MTDVFDGIVVLCAAVDQWRSSVASLTARVSTLEKSCSQSSSAPAPTAAATENETEAAAEDDDDDFELFGSDDEVICVTCWSLKQSFGTYHQTIYDIFLLTYSI